MTKKKKCKSNNYKDKSNNCKDKDSSEDRVFEGYRKLIDELSRIFIFDTDDEIQYLKKGIYDVSTITKDTDFVIPKADYYRIEAEEDRDCYILYVKSTTTDYDNEIAKISKYCKALDDTDEPISVYPLIVHKHKLNGE